MAIAALTDSITVGGVIKVIRCDVVRAISNAEAIASDGPAAITSHTGNNLTNVRTGLKRPVLCSTQLICPTKAPEIPTAASTRKPDTGLTQHSGCSFYICQSLWQIDPVFS